MYLKLRGGSFYEAWGILSKGELMVFNKKKKTANRCHLQLRL